MSMFTPSYKKISRAESKLDAIEVLLSQWYQEGIPYSIRRELSESRAHLIARIEKLPPDEVAWELVEAVGHLRSALDKMLIAIVEGNGRGTSGVSFPFGGLNERGDPIPFPDGRHKKAIENKLTPEQWSLVLEQKPYLRGNDLLWAVNEIANKDKHHKELIKANARLIPKEIVLKGGGGVFNATPGKALFAFGGDLGYVCKDPQKENIVMSLAAGPGYRDPDVESIAIDVVFVGLRSVNGRGVLHTLGEQILIVKRIIKDFERLQG